MKAADNVVSPGQVRIIILLDAMWVLASVVVVTVQAFGISALGYFMISAIGVWVGLMAYLQYAGLKRILGDAKSV